MYRLGLATTLLYIISMYELQLQGAVTSTVGGPCPRVGMENFPCAIHFRCIQAEKAQVTRRKEEIGIMRKRGRENHKNGKYLTFHVMKRRRSVEGTGSAAFTRMSTGPSACFLVPH